MTPRSFLPQIVGLFYAHFDATLGPVVQHQVPENLITSHTSSDTDNNRSRSRSRSRSRAPRPVSPASASSRTPYGSAILNFALISEYVIPKKALHGRLVTLLTTGYEDDDKAEYRVMGFPNVMSGEGGRYKRNEYMWNLCFVFHASSSLEAFEPVVRKCARILRSAERDSSYLSAPSPDHTPLPAVLEQLFEDLNSYSETSIPLDGFNSLELKLFPFYPNPPECEDWHVPIALVDLNALKDDNWDITAARVSQFIDGVNHVKRIAQLAEADEALTRETLKHMLYYQVVMMIDIFQYSNMYTLKPAISRLASDETIMSECSSYVTRQAFPLPEWPTLLKLYSKLTPGVTIHDWIESNEVLSLGIDPRRFVSFGIIKGFLRRVHRWPKMMERSSPLIPLPVEGRRRVGFDDTARLGSSTTLGTRGDRSHAGDSTVSRLGGAGAGESAFTLRSVGSNTSLGVSPSSRHAATPPSTSGRSPAGRKSLAYANTGHSTGTIVGVGISHHHHSQVLPRSHASVSVSVADSHPSTSSRRAVGGASVSNYSHTGTHPGGSGIRFGGLTHRQREEAAAIRAAEEMEEDLIAYLDGTHHADEIQVRFGMGWDKLEGILGLEGVKGGMGKKGVTVVLR
ncbi:hypothetical protein IAT40_005569 [Kwoniella sp. CBS 6097]